jgi:AraC family transcriptional regulator
MPSSALERELASREAGDAAAAGQHALEVVAGLFGAAPPLIDLAFGCGTLLTRRWTHGPVSGRVPPLGVHMLFAHFGAAQSIDWRGRDGPLRSRTRPGSITQIPSRTSGALSVEGPTETSHIYLADDRLRACAEAVAPGRPVEFVDRAGFDDPATARVLEMLSEPSLDVGPASRLFADHAIDLLCLRIVQAHSSVAETTLRRDPRGLADWQVKRVTSYMRDNLDGEVGLEALSRLVGLSRFHFCTAFRFATGETPHAWLTALRMTRARQLLAQLQLPITEIALAVGYQTPSAFSATFRRSAQVTPSAFRRAL